MEFFRKLILLLLLISILITESSAQEQGNRKFKLLKEFFGEKSVYREAKYGQDYYLELCFEHLRHTSKINTRKVAGIKLLKYNGNFCYDVRLDKRVKLSTLQELGITVFAKPLVEFRISEGLSEVLNTKSSDGWLEVAIIGYDHKNFNWVDDLQIEFDMVLNSPPIKGNNYVNAKVHRHDVKEIANKPYVSFIDFSQEAVQPLNFENNGVQRTNVLNAGIPGGRNLVGEGIVVGVGDGGELGEHLDFTNRNINYANGTYSSYGAHGDHVAGIVCGGGMINPRHKGAAPKATIITNKTSFITQYIDSYYNNHEMVLTNNSYGVSYNCDSNGEYNHTSATLDIQMNDYPKVLHCFAAGNSGKNTCDPYPPGYRSVLKFYQAAKNILVIGNVGEDRIIAAGSSRGPVQDGRIKPEICGVGREVISTGRNFDYYTNGGTSMATPSVMGSIALLNERYRQLHGGERPDGALLKAVVCNTADDLGNEHPDYMHGFGLYNARKAVELIEGDWMVYDSLSTDDNNVHTVSVPEGVGQLKVMLYWHDKEAASGSVPVLVNNLDMVVNEPGGSGYFPWVLNPDPAHVADVATRGVDNLNNIEQVTINAPVSGNYTINISGSEVPFGPQKYYLVYYFDMPEVMVTFPYGAEHLLPNGTEKIQWDVDNNNTSTFAIDYSADGGSSWINIDSGVAPDQRSYNWTIPDIYCETALIKVTKEIDGTSDTSDAFFRIMQAPANITVDALCDGYLELNWDDVDYERQFEVYKYITNDMELVAFSDTTSLIFEQPEVEGNHWFGVVGVCDSGVKTNRSIADNGVPLEVGTCPWENDIKLQNRHEKIEGRANTSSALTANDSLAIWLKNVGSNTVSNMMVNVRLDDGAVFSQAYSNPILPGDSVWVRLNQSFDFSLPGSYLLDAWVELSDDNYNANDSVAGVVEILQMPNSPVTLPFEENFNIGDASYSESEFGLAGLDRWDFENGSNGLLTVSEADGTIYIEGSGALNNSVSNYLIWTLNLSDIRVDIPINLSFDYNALEIQTNSKVYVRGSDTDLWLELFDLDFTTGWAASGNINISNILDANGQAKSSSTQIRFSQEGVAGYALDNVKVIEGFSLPVEFISFNAFKIGNDAMLEWKTSFERNNAYFEVEVADTDEDLSSGNFRAIGKLEPKFELLQLYQFKDVESWKYGTRYYRIKQVDLDGKATYSTIRSLEFDVIGEILMLSENPFKNEIRFAIDNPVARKLIVDLTDIHGKVIQHFTPFVEPGKQEVMLPVNNDLPSGVYNLSFKLKTGAIVIRLVKQQ